MLYLKQLTTEFNRLQQKHGSNEYSAIYGAGQIQQPKLMLVFMNPTARNVSAHKSWRGLNAPWLGTKQVWRMLYDLELLEDIRLLQQIETTKPEQWTENFANKLYHHVAESSLYITNIAKCTLPDARPISSQVYKQYLPTMLQEIKLINPQAIITFGNQVSSVLLGQNISVSNYTGSELESLIIAEQTYSIYPCYYPVGQGQRNMPLAKNRIRTVLKQT